LHKREQPELLGLGALPPQGRERRGPIEHHDVMRIPWEQECLRGSKTRGVPHAVRDVLHLVILPIIPAVILGEDHLFDDRPSMLPIDP
jgi:hypothetical protein